MARNNKLRTLLQRDYVLKFLIIFYKLYKNFTTVKPCISQAFQLFLIENNPMYSIAVTFNSSKFYQTLIFI